jgi:hypothetical protein
VTDQPTDTAPAGKDPDTRLDRLEAKVDAVIDRLSGLVGGAHKDATSTTQERLDAPGAMAEEVRKELARAERERIAAETEQQREARLKAVEDKVVPLTEKVPLPPPRKIERIMGWHG